MPSQFFARPANLGAFRAIVATCLLLGTAESALAQRCENTALSDRPKIGLALGGGGARGYAHVGVLEVLEELRIPYDYIAGTSMGAIVGGLAATGMDSSEITAVVENADWDDLFSDKTSREDLPLRRKQDDELGLFGPKLGVGEGSELLPAGFVAGQKILFMFESVVSERTQVTRFDELPVPYRAVATDIVTGEIVVMGDGQLANAMRASMSVPGAFDPVKTGGQLLVDGGLVQNLPVQVVRDMGAEIVIAVSVGTPLKTADNINNVLSVMDQMTSLLIANNTRISMDLLAGEDVLITPELGDITAADFSRFEEAIPTGFEAADQLRDQLARLSVSEAEYAAWRNGVTECVDGPPEIQFVHLDNHSRFADEVIEELITIEPGQALDIEQLDHDLRQIYGLGFIRMARYQVVEENGRQGIEIEVQADDRGNDFIETGLSLTGSDRGLLLNLQLAYLKTDLDRYGAELRTGIQIGSDFGLFADYWKPMGRKMRWVVNPLITFSRRTLSAYNDFGHPVGEIEIDEAVAKLRFGREFARHASLFASVNRYTGNYGVAVGEPQPAVDFEGGEWHLDLRYDRLDDRFLPRHGTWSRLEYIKSDESLGADVEFEQIRFYALHSQTWGLHNLQLAARYNTTLDNNAPVYALYTGGGFQNMSGFEPNELVGQHFGFVSLGYRYELGRTGLLPAYTGITFEYGNAGQRRSDVFGDGILNGALYMGYNSPIGPLYLGYGYNTDRSGLIFLRLGTVLGGQSIGRR
jgi:NTE family protein